MGSICMVSAEHCTASHYTPDIFVDDCYWRWKVGLD